MKTDLIKLGMQILTVIAVGLLVLGGVLIWKNPEGLAGYIMSAFAALQLVISKIGEAMRLSIGAPLDPAPPPPNHEGTA